MNRGCGRQELISRQFLRWAIGRRWRRRIHLQNGTVHGRFINRQQLHSCHQLLRVHLYFERGREVGVVTANKIMPRVLIVTQCILAQTFELDALILFINIIRDVVEGVKNTLLELLLLSGMALKLRWFKDSEMSVWSVKK